jgi:hypothetical protein
MSTSLTALTATAAALALTWFFCMRPMRRQAGSGHRECLAPPGQGIEDRLNAARQELAQFQAGRPGIDGAGSFTPREQSIDDQIRAVRREPAQLQADRGSGPGTAPPHR